MRGWPLSFWISSLSSDVRVWQQYISWPRILLSPLFANGCSRSCTRKVIAHVSQPGQRLAWGLKSNSCRSSSFSQPKKITNPRIPISSANPSSKHLITLILWKYPVCITTLPLTNEQQSLLWEFSMINGPFQLPRCGCGWRFKTKFRIVADKWISHPPLPLYPSLFAMSNADKQFVSD